MTFASREFALLLCVTLALYYALSQRARMVLLLVASYVFYAYWSPLYALLILGSTLVDYAAALALDRSSESRTRKLLLAASVSVNLGLLATFKYTDFALDSLRLLLGPLGHGLPGPLELVLPIGISFYTFQTMSYTIDVYRGQKRAERDFLLVALYVAFFPQLVAGPIERAGRLMPQLTTRHAPELANFEEGGRLILWGLFKKLVVADRLVLAAFPPFGDPTGASTGMLAFAAVGMTIALYLDFSAYSEIACGTARLFGVRLTRNFDCPFATSNIVDYWRRWHISMSDWVQDYLYRPLGGFRRRGFLAQARIVLITMGLVGLWHGARWTFVVWGLAQGVCLLGYLVVRLRSHDARKRRARTPHPLWSLAGWATTRAINVAVCVLFFAPSLALAGDFYSGLYLHPTAAGFESATVRIGFAGFTLFWILHFVQSRIDVPARIDALHPALRGGAYALLALGVLFGAVDSSAPFIYYQF